MSFNITPEIGKTYKVVHSRKGTFSLRVTSISGTSLTGVIADGKARFINDDDREVGDELTIASTLCTLSEE